ncbi:MAG: hypothetical protein RIG84_20130 [Roseovarius sp.]
MKITALPKARAVALLLGALMTALIAETGPARAQESDWRIEVVPYLWGSSVSGTVATFPGLPAANIDADFTDVLDNLDMGAMLAFTATRGRFGILGDLQYVDLGATAITPGPAFGGLQFDAKQLIATIGAEWSVAQAPNYDMRVVGALRYWDVNSDLLFLPGILPGVLVSGSDSWLDGMVGLRGRYDLGERTYLTGWALAGAGGSDFTADVMVGMGYRLSDRSSLVGGYRYLMVDRSNGSFLYDVEQDGLLLGVKLALN